MRGLQRDVNETSAGATESAGTIIAGKYKLLDKPLGEGGMGTVWMAEQRAPVKRSRPGAKQRGQASFIQNT